MPESLSPNTQAILLLTARLASGSRGSDLPLVTPARYRRLSGLLYESGLEPADFLGRRRCEAIEVCRDVLSEADADQILDRGLQLSHAVDRWRARSIWVVSRADKDYPKRLRERFSGDAPAVLFGCGEMSLLESGGLAVVGSRKVDDELTEGTKRVAELSAEAGVTIVSGGAKGIDQISMQTCVDAGGQAVGMLADSLERKAVQRSYREALIEGRMVLVTPFDPGARFFVGNAMQRNKFIYGLADAGLVMNADFEKGGTWAGAIEQLEKWRFVPVYVRSTGRRSKALRALIQRGALEWPNPQDATGLRDALTADLKTPTPTAEQMGLPFGEGEDDNR